MSDVDHDAARRFADDLLTPGGYIDAAVCNLARAYLDKCAEVAELRYTWDDCLEKNKQLRAALAALCEKLKAVRELDEYDEFRIERYDKIADALLNEHSPTGPAHGGS